MEVSTRWINISIGDSHYQAYLALPPTGSGPGILLLQEIFGINPHIRAVATQYAQDGYVVLAPDIFWRIQPHIELGYEGTDRDQAFALMQKVQLSETMDDIDQAAKTLRALPEVNGKIAAIGYCFGGQLAYRLAARGSIDAAVAYYGGGIEHALDEADKINIPMVFHYGEKDAHIPLSAVDKVKKRVKECFKHKPKPDSDAQFYVYAAAEHGFNCWDRASYRQQAAALARGRTLVFLAEH